MFPEFAAGTGIREFDPGDLDLLARDAGGFQSTIRFGPARGFGISPARHRLTALRAIHDGHPWRLFRVRVGQLFEPGEFLSGVRHADRHQADLSVSR